MAQEMTAQAEHHDAHAGPGFYVAIWAALVVLLAISVATGHLGNPLLAVLLVYGIAVVKAFLVANWYMHLKVETRWILLILAGGIFALLVVFAGFYTDVVHPYGAGR